jgi:hypothetical protein
MLHPLKPVFMRLIAVFIENISGHEKKLLTGIEPFTHTPSTRMVDAFLKLLNTFVNTFKQS